MLSADDISSVHRLSFETAPDAIMLMDESSSVVLANAAARELAAALPAFATLREDAAWPGFIADVRARGRGSFEAKIGERALAVVGRAMGTRTLLFLRDVTLARETEEDVTRLWGLASVGALTASLVHDIGNLMTPLGALGDALSAGAGGLTGAAIVELQRATRSAGELVRDVRAYLRGRPARVEHLDLNVVIDELRPLITRVVGESVQVVFAPDSEVCETLVDRTRLERCVLNLVANARDAMPEGGRLILRSYSALLDGESFVALSVVDEGIGMTSSQRARAFDALFTTKSGTTGTGLGLWMVRRFVRENGGRVSIHSEPGEGTQITLYLPRIKANTGDKLPRTDPYRVRDGNGEIQTKSAFR